MFFGMGEKCLTIVLRTGTIILGIVYAGKVQRFIDNRHKPGNAFCASWRCLLVFTGPIFPANIMHNVTTVSFLGCCRAQRISILMITGGNHTIVYRKAPAGISRYDFCYCAACRWTEAGDCHVAALLAMTSGSTFNYKLHMGPLRPPPHWLMLF